MSRGRCSSCPSRADGETVLSQRENLLFPLLTGIASEVYGAGEEASPPGLPRPGSAQDESGGEGRACFSSGHHPLLRAPLCDFHIPSGEGWVVFTSEMLAPSYLFYPLAHAPVSSNCCSASPCGRLRLQLLLLYFCAAAPQSGRRPSCRRLLALACVAVHRGTFWVVPGLLFFPSRGSGCETFARKWFETWCAGELKSSCGRPSGVPGLDRAPVCFLFVHLFSVVWNL